MRAAPRSIRSTRSPRGLAPFRSLRRLALVGASVLAALVLVLPPAVEAGCGGSGRLLTAPHDCAETDVPEYVTGEVGEYVTGEIATYETGTVPTYQDREIAEYVTGADRYVVITAEQLILFPTLDVMGAGDRRRARFARLLASYEGDRARIVAEHGFPRHRHRENAFGRITEHWTYPDAHTTYVFCGDRLIDRLPY